MNKVEENLKLLEDKKYYNPKKWIISFIFGIHRIILKDSAIAIIFGLFFILGIHGCLTGTTAREKLANSFMLFLIASIIHIVEGFRYKTILRINIINNLKKNNFFPEGKEIEDINLDIESKLLTSIESNNFLNFIFKKISNSSIKIFFINLSLLSIIMAIALGTILGKLDIDKKEAKKKELDEQHYSLINNLKNEINAKNKNHETIINYLFKIDSKRLPNLYKDVTPNEFKIINQTLINEYKIARETITKKDWLRSQFDPKLKYLIYVAKFLENIQSNNDGFKNSDLLKKALLLTPAGNIEEAVSLCKRNIDRVYRDVTYEDSFLLRRVADKAVGVSVGDDNNEKFTKFIWEDSLIGKNAFGMDIRNGIYCEVIFEKSLNTKNQLNYSEKVNKLIVGRTQIQ